ncbi:MAG: hypothetical protein NZX77_11620 [Polyangiaceae bacterium]|nr:hypothetical protein [Polyangiaceae bacterium]
MSSHHDDIVPMPLRLFQIEAARCPTTASVSTPATLGPGALPPGAPAVLWAPR